MTVEYVIDVENMSFSYGGVLILDDITLRIKNEEFFGIIGPNASGKSTFLKLLLGLLEPDKGNIRILGQKPETVRRKIGYVPQYPTFRRDFPISVEDVVILGRLGVTKGFGRFTRVDKEKTRAAMEAVELDAIAKNPVAVLSGGQLQRMLIARALACEPEILILDEPTAGIDLRAEENIFALLKKYNEHMTIIIVSHDVAFISGYVDRVGCLNKTLVCHETRDISGKTIEELYGGTVKMIQHNH